MALLLIIASLPRSNYYYHRNHPCEPQQHLQEREVIQQICVEHQGRYGYRRVTLELRRRGFQTNHKLVMKLMQQEHLTCMLREKKYHSYRGKVGKIVPNLLQRDFKAERPNLKWTTDITEFKLLGQKRYLSPIMDLFNGEIVSYSLSTSPNFLQITEMLKAAFRKIPDNSQLILHSDQGWQYQMNSYQTRASARACPGRETAMTTVSWKTSLVFSSRSSTTTKTFPLFSTLKKRYLSTLITTISAESRLN